MFVSMSQDQILDRVRKVTVEKLKVKEEEVVPTALFQEDLGADSLDVVEVIMGIEDEFSISIPEEDAIKLKTVQDAVAYIASKTS